MTPDISASLSAIPQIRTELDQVKEEMASVSARLAKVETQSASSSAILANLTNWSNLTGPNIDIASFSAELATISGNLTVLGKTQLAETTIGGALSVGLLHFDDVTASISSLTGELTVEGDLKVTGKLKLPNSSGKVTIVAGAKDLTIDVLGVSTSSAMFATPEERAVPVSARATESGRLTIQIPDALPVNLKVNWWIVN